MKPTQTLFAAVVFIAALLSASVAQAALQTRLGGLAVYDTDLNITWLANANVNGPMSWTAANTWAANLSIVDAVNNITYGNWRLPTVTDTGTPGCDNAYSGTDCGEPCVKGRELLARRGIPFTERDAQNNPADQEALKKLIGALDVPVLIVGESKTKGYEESLWQASLDSAGYPRTRLPGQAPLRQAPPPAAAKAADPASGEPPSK